jgi:hypothetical protein
VADRGDQQVRNLLQGSVGLESRSRLTAQGRDQQGNAGEFLRKFLPEQVFQVVAPRTL